jgi:hypothetical protein
MALIHLLAQFWQRAEGAEVPIVQAALGLQAEAAAGVDITVAQIQPEHLGKVTLAGVE